jgi:hypothetical protein
MAVRIRDEQRAKALFGPAEPLNMGMAVSDPCDRRLCRDTGRVFKICLQELSENIQNWLNSNKGTKCEIGIKKSKAILGRFESCFLRQNNRS